MRRTRFALLCLPLLLGVSACRNAGPTGSLPVEITDVRVGIPPGPLVGDEGAGRRDAMVKAGHWAPVLVKITGKGRLEGAELVVQTVDGDDVLNEYTVRLPVLDFSADQPEYSIISYCRPGKVDSPVSISVRARGQSVSYPERSLYALDPSYYLYVSLGARYPGLRLPGLDDQHLRRSEIGVLDQPAELPRRWFGYQTADLLILNTTNEEFLSGLLNDTERREALVEWVRRGGRLVIAVGKNQNLLQNREDLKELLPVDFTGTATPSLVRINWGSAVNDELADPTNRAPLTIARVTPKADRNVRVLTEARAEGKAQERFPLVLQAAYGLGRVTILTIDPDQPPFTRWKLQGEFWNKLLNDAGPIYAKASSDPGLASSDLTSDTLAVQMHGSLESFDGVPVISFGWVALFILLYILVVGPLDYLFLKKVVKRMELTWVTFPIVVVIVSVAAYFTAYALKGSDQKINKVDLIDVDLTTKTVTGHTWFSIFSPRVQNYTVGVEPAEGWGIGSEPISSPMISWLPGRVQKGRTSLFRRSYEYETGAGGLLRVPIQVWSTKGFEAAWHHPLDPSAPPIAVDLQAVGEDLTGSVTSHLPVPLEQASLFYRGKVYDLDVLYPGANNRKQVTRAARKSFEEWTINNRGLSPPAAAPPRMPFGPPPPPPVLEPTGNVVRTIMFHEQYETSRTRTGRNAHFRELDQSWRINADDPGQAAILYGRLPIVNGQAEDIGKQPGTVTHLWLGALPDGKAQRPTIPGTMRQETHLRFYVPVRRAN